MAQRDLGLRWCCDHRENPKGKVTGTAVLGADYVWQIAGFVPYSRSGLLFTGLCEDVVGVNAASIAVVRRVGVAWACTQMGREYVCPVPDSRRLDVMMFAMVVRRLKPDTYEHFRRAWEPDSPAHWPAGMTRIWIARSDDDPDVVATWSLFDLDEAGYEALRDDPEWTSAEVGRVERMSEFEAELLASGFFHVLEEIVPPTVSAD